MQFPYPYNVVLVSGSRHLTEEAHYETVSHWLERAKPNVVIQGGAKGADALAKKWAEDNGVHCAEVNALWGQYGKPAGIKRNRAMLLLRPTVLLAFPIKESKGTRHMIKIAKTELEVEIHVIEMMVASVR